jgi:uncharacterized protein DUF2760
MAFITILVDVVIYYGFDNVIAVVDSGEDVGKSVTDIGHILISWFVPLSSILFAFLGFVLWMVLKVFYAKSIADIAGKNSGKKNKGMVDQKAEQEKKQKLFLHTLSILQREGRLLDFFDEDLKNYDDEQIGMAVRSIQEDCKKAVKKYIAIKPIYNQEEGEEIQLEAGFDPDSVKLVGRVAGEPPFKGVLKHRGWKAGKKEIPRLSEVKDATIITPAEVEIS